MKSKRFALLLTFLLVISFFSVIEGKKKFKIGDNARKVKRFFIHKKHHDKKSSSTSVPFSIISPTATTFTRPITRLSTEVYFTYTDKNFNYFLGYPSGGANGANFYRNAGLIVAQPTQKCGCCDNKLIIVTRAADDVLI